jgi:hypothetical protein
MLGVSFAISGYRILTASEAQQARVIGQEAGAQLYGWGGAVLAGAACVGLGVATGGVGLVLCGMAGGLLGGMAGSAIGGAMVDSLGRPVAPNDPFGLTTGHSGPAQLTGQPNAADPLALSPSGSHNADTDWIISTVQPEILIY